ncbi:hypothetical protein [Actinophytocola xanthii]|uniref:SH3b domain-containing protein n=1 Tax=Actinophytocola xanthii TaxID=1912961 RepID=A0A1Q8C6I1_9PSEU|nr:hypothetical protein [Actinophytocola xanthii]OLF09976.1 hypothetical protein BU204_32220 [Actinophytocola xanthii]
MKSSLLVGALVAASLFGFAPAATAEPGITVDLGRPSTRTNIALDGAVRLGTAPNRAAEATRTGLATYPLALTTPANTFAATVDSGVPAGAELAIDVRGRRADGQWSEWTEIRPSTPAVLPVSTADVELRAMLSAPEGVATPALRSLVVTPSRSSAAPSASVRSAGLSYRVFATREGLVGGTTANGHVITSRDHFVALPSRRGLSANWAGEYSVRVCASNGRCEWAPVWDVGPWNTRDDYWNPASVRQEWKDLPQGRPEAQAAYENGYNGGKDQFGRTVANPAGIDLADGTFWDGLGLTNNAWVTVTYQWTGTSPAGFVDTASDPLNVRSGTTTSSGVVGMAANYAQVRIECRTTGQSVTGTQGTSSVWYRLAAGKFVAAAYIRGGGSAPTC